MREKTNINISAFQPSARHVQTTKEEYTKFEKTRWKRFHFGVLASVIMPDDDNMTKMLLGSDQAHTHSQDILTLKPNLEYKFKVQVIDPNIKPKKRADSPTRLPTVQIIVYRDVANGTPKLEVQRGINNISVETLYY